jgi:regulatory protein
VAALARRDHGRVELSRKLKTRLKEGETPADLEAVLDRLQAEGLLSDLRMAQSLARARATRQGSLRIRQALEQRGVDRETISGVLPSLAQQLEQARELWRRRFMCETPADARERARQARFLAGRGFPAEVVARVLREAGRASPDS